MIFLIYRGESLNPCFSGICSLSSVEFPETPQVHCLNPCFSGICSLSVPLYALRKTPKGS